MSPYRTTGNPIQVPEEPKRKKRYTATCWICSRTDCWIHGEESAEFLQRCNHSPDDDRRTKRRRCAWCGLKRAERKLRKILGGKSPDPVRY